MFKTCALAFTLALLLVPPSLEAARPVFKCSLNGSVTYQNDPCPSGEPRKAPTVEQLNAERQKGLRQAASAAAAGPGVMGEKEQPKIALPSLAAPVGPAKCDGRIHCSQMTSCAEARYFLAHCPGVEMDGDANGIPCEKQWCRR